MPGSRPRCSLPCSRAWRFRRQVPSSNKPTPVLGGGSDVMFHVSSALDLLYDESPGCTTIAPTGTQPLDNSCITQPGDPTTENRYHDRISESFPIGGSAGVTQLCEQGLTGVAKINYVRQTSAPSATVCTGSRLCRIRTRCTDVRDLPGSVRSQPSSPGQPGLPLSGSCTGVTTELCLSQAQLQGIFVNCSITNWNQVGGNNAPIKIYTVLPAVRHSQGLGHVPGRQQLSLWRHPCRSDRQQRDPGRQPAGRDRAGVGRFLDRALLGQPGWFGPGRRRWSDAQPTNIQNGSFPFSRFLYNVYCGGDPTKSNKCGTAPKASIRSSPLHRLQRLDLQGIQRSQGRRPDHRCQLPHRDRQHHHPVRLRTTAPGRNRWRHHHHQLLPAGQDLISR